MFYDWDLEFFLLTIYHPDAGRITLETPQRKSSIFGELCV